MPSDEKKIYENPNLVYLKIKINLRKIDVITFECLCSIIFFDAKNGQDLKEYIICAIMENNELNGIVLH